MLADIRDHLAQETGLSRAEREQIALEIADDILGHGPLERLLADDTVTRDHGQRPVRHLDRARRPALPDDVRFHDESHLRRILNKIVAQVGRRIDESSAMVDARLPDGSRINAIIPPLSLSGPLVTIRKFSRNRLTLEDMIRLGTLTTETVEFLERCVQARLNILISGGTGSGKTTLLNVLSTAIPDDERIVTIEDAAELRLQPAARAAARVAAAEHRGRGRGPDPRRSCATACACAPTGSSSARFAAPRRSTCSRR